MGCDDPGHLRLCTAARLLLLAMSGLLPASRVLSRTRVGIEASLDCSRWRGRALTSGLRHYPSVSEFLYQRVSAQHGDALPELPDRPFKLLLIVEEACSILRRVALAQSVAGSGCRYLMAWGETCRELQDAVNLENLRRANFAAIADSEIVISTAHPDETLEELFWFARYTAMHPCHDLTDVVLLQIGGDAREQELRAAYAAV